MISFIAATQASSANGDPNPVTVSVAPGVPGGTVKNDLMLAFIFTKVAGLGTPASGWTSLGTETSVSPGRWPGVSWSIYAYQRVATASEPGSYTWTTSSSGPAHGSSGEYPQIWVTHATYRVINNAVPVGTSANGTGSSGIGQFANATVTNKRRGMLVYGGQVSMQSADGTIGTPSGMTARSSGSFYDGGAGNHSGQAVMVADEFRPSVGSATRGGGVTSTLSEGWCSILVAITEALAMPGD